MHQPRDNIKYCATLMRNRVNIAGVMKIGSRKQFINGTCRGTPVANLAIIGRTPSGVPGKAKACDRFASQQCFKSHGRGYHINMIHLSYEAERIDKSEEHTSELQSLMRISYAVFCLKTKKTKQHQS